MCMPKAPKVPELPPPDINSVINTPQRLPTQAPPPPPPAMAIPVTQSLPPINTAPSPDIDITQTPPPQLTQTTTEDATLKKRKSKRAQLQQASRGTSALRIERDKSIGTQTGGTGSTGLNIPK